MKFLFHSSTADGGALALRCAEEGHQVKVYIDNKDFKTALNGLVPKASTFAEGIAWGPDLIVFDMVGQGALADRMRSAKKKVIGASLFQDKMELDRAFGMELCKKMGIRMPDYREFKAQQINDAMAYAKTKERLVMKPSGNQGEALSYCARGPDDMLDFMEWAVENNEVKGDFILQDFVKGIELSTEVWFSRGRPVTPGNGTMEAKKFMAGDIGPNTGCMGSVVWPYPVAEPRIVQQTLKKLYAPLAAIEYSGPLDVNCIVDEKGQSYFLEFTARFGYSAIYALCEILEMPLSELLFKAADGDLDKMDLKSEFGLAGTVAIPPYPLDPDDPQDVWEFKETAGKAIKGVPLGHSWFLDAEKGKKGELVTAGIEGLILNVTASGPQLSNAQKTLYERIEEVNLADKMYRNDLADRAMKQLPKLRAMNYQVPDPVTFYGQKKKVMAAV